MYFALGVALALSAVIPATRAGSVPVARSLMPAAQTIEEYVRGYFADAPIMIDVARCESRFRQFDKDGSVHRGEINPKDVGVMQVNEFYHSKTADKLDLDLYTIEGNLSYAKYLFEKEGTTPWLSSSPCWGKENQIARK